jgi:hypothetical protein
MLRAAATGAINFAQFDPWDNWWWRRMRLIIAELGRQNNQESLTTQHQHYLAYLSNGQLSDDSWEAQKAAADETLNGLLRGYFPWRADEIGAAGAKTGRDHAVEQFYEIYGKPGEPRYEQMMAEWSAYLAKGKLTPRQKDLERKQRREAAQQRQLATAG